MGDCADRDLLLLRCQARAEQLEVVLRRLERHRAIAQKLLEGPNEAALDLMAEARAMVALWRAERICSLDYIEQWNTVLGQSAAAVAAAITTDEPSWDAMRQCSPFPRVAPH